MNKISRKQFIQTTGLATAGILLSSSVLAFDSNKTKIKAIAFDGFPIFDPRPIFETVNKMFPEKGKHFIEIWKTKQFEYQWLRVSADQYKNFWEVTKDALDFAVVQCGLNLSDKEKKLIMNKYKSIDVWPDVPLALSSLKELNLKLGVLSNMTSKMLNSGIKNSNTQDFFDFVISTDQQQTFKPSPVAYKMGLENLKLKKEEILFVAFAGWDMAGAKWFGYPTFWVNRLGSPIDNLDAKPDGKGTSLNDLVNFVQEYNK